MESLNLTPTVDQVVGTEIAEMTRIKCARQFAAKAAFAWVVMPETSLENVFRLMNVQV